MAQDGRCIDADSPRAARPKLSSDATQFDMYNIPGLAGEHLSRTLACKRAAHHVRAYRMDYASAPTIKPSRHQRAAALGLMAELGGLVDVDDSYYQVAWPGRMRMWYRWPRRGLFWPRQDAA
jgi:hypothetical protein